METHLEHPCTNSTWTLNKSHYLAILFMFIYMFYHNLGKYYYLYYYSNTWIKKPTFKVDLGLHR